MVTGIDSLFENSHFLLATGAIILKSRRTTNIHLFSGEFRRKLQVCSRMESATFFVARRNGGTFLT